MQTLPAELLNLIVVFQPLFTKPVWEHAKVLLLGASRLATATTASSSYEYDGDGRRLKQLANGTSTFYLWSSVFGQPALELNSSGGVVRAYVFSSSGQRVALQASNGSFYWTHNDQLGGSHKLTDTSGNVAYTAEYDPHGNLRYETGTTTLTTRKFTGYERDAANLDFAQARTLEYRFGRLYGSRVRNSVLPMGENRRSHLTGTSRFSAAPSPHFTARFAQT